MAVMPFTYDLHHWRKIGVHVFRRTKSMARGIKSLAEDKVEFVSDFSFEILLLSTLLPDY